MKDMRSAPVQTAHHPETAPAMDQHEAMQDRRAEAFPFNLAIVLSYQGTPQNMERARNDIVSHTDVNLPLHDMRVTKRKLANGNERTETSIVHGSRTNFVGNYMFDKFRMMPLAASKVQTEFRFVNYKQQTARTQPTLDIVVLAEENMMHSFDQYRDSVEDRLKTLDKQFRKQFKLERTHDKAAYQRIALG